MKKLLGILLVTMLLGIVINAVASAPGETVSVTLKVTANSKAMTAKISFSFDSNALEFVSASGENGWTAPQNARGSFGIANADSIIPTDNIGTITFRVKAGAASGQYEIKATVTRSIDTNYRNVDMSVSGCFVTVESSGSSGYDPQTNPPSYTTPQPSVPAYPTATPSAQTTPAVSTVGYPCSGYTTIEKLNIRRGARSDAKKVTRIEAAGTNLTLTGETYDRSGKLWYSVKLATGESGYVDARYIAKGTSSATVAPSYPTNTPPNFTATGIQATTNTKKVNVREKPRSGSQKVTRIDNAGTTIYILGQEYDSTGKIWYLIRTREGKQGYIQSKYVDNPDVSTSSVRSMSDVQRGSFSTIDVEFVRSKDFNAYSGPGKNYVRGANGRAYMSSNDSAYVYGKENGWVLVQYYVSERQWRFGYVSESLISFGTVPDLNFTRYSSSVIAIVNVTDDPLHSQAPLITLEAGTTVKILGQLDNWTYIEAGNVRGFIPSYTIR